MKITDTTAAKAAQAVSILIASGLNIIFVSRTLGHSNASITLNTYGHLFDREQHAERARTAMDAALTGAGCSP